MASKKSRPSMSFVLIQKRLSADEENILRIFLACKKSLSQAVLDGVEHLPPINELAELHVEEI